SNVGTNHPGEAGTSGVVSRGLLLCVEETSHDVHRLFPQARFIVDALLAGACKLVVFRFTMIGRYIPSRCDEALLFELDERRIDRAVGHSECIAAGLLDPPG